MIEGLGPDPDLVVRHEGGSFVERATGFAAGCAKPRGNNDLPMPTSRLRQYPEQKNGPVTRSARLENRRRDGRSDAHTSELQVTKAQLVCRLLLEKKKSTTISTTHQAATIRSTKYHD